MPKKVQAAPRCKGSKKCDCAKKLDKKAGDSAQSDTSSEPGFCDLFSNFGSMLGPWIPYFGGTALVLMLLGFLTKNVDKMIDMFESNFCGDSSKAAAGSEQNDSCRANCALRVNINRIKWPNG